MKFKTKPVCTSECGVKLKKLRQMKKKKLLIKSKIVKNIEKKNCFSFLSRI